MASAELVSSRYSTPDSEGRGKCGFVFRMNEASDGYLLSLDIYKGLAQLREGHPASWMLWESEPTAENRERLQQLGVQSTVFDPCGNRPQAGDFLSVMSKNVANLKQVFDQ